MYDGIETHLSTLGALLQVFSHLSVRLSFFTHAGVHTNVDNFLPKG